MSDTAVTPTNQTAPTASSGGMLLDGDAPRLGSAPILPPAPMGGVGTTTSQPDAAAMPMVTPVPGTTEAGADAPRFATNAPVIPEADLPTLPVAAPATPATTESDEPASTTTDPDGPQHPMAHLMPPKSKPTEASIRAAEQRAIKKAKARKIKICVAVGALVFTALAAPPFVSWLTNAINESGSVQSDEPAG